VIVAATAIFYLAGSFWPLRAVVEKTLRRIARNLSVAGISLVATSLLQPLILFPVVAWIARDQIGLLQIVEWPRWIELVAGVLLLDYALWWWHRATHRIPFLWRFHLVHHIDLDLDTSTALRFHFGELALSVPVRAATVIVIGVDPQTLWLWQTILFASILFHHSNLRLPLGVERILVRFIVTPRMHGIHHSIRREETDSNWSSLFTVWDFLHRTFRFDVPDEKIVIGVPAYQDSSAVTIGRMLTLPFRRQRDDWS